MSSLMSFSHCYKYTIKGNEYSRVSFHAQVQFAIFYRKEDNKMFDIEANNISTARKTEHFALF